MYKVANLDINYIAKCDGQYLQVREEEYLC